MRYKEFKKQEETQLDEIKMAPGSLAAAAANIDATAGMEFEMVIPGVGNIQDSDAEPERDYDQDRRFNSLEDIRDFFYEGDYNSSIRVDRVIQEIIQEYRESDEFYDLEEEEWDNVKEDKLRDFLIDRYGDEKRKEIIDQQTKLTPGFGINDEEFRAKVEEKFKEAIDEMVENTLEDPDRDYEEARERWQQNWEPDDIEQGAFEYLRNQGNTAMSDIENSYDLDWPYYTYVNETDVDAIIGDVAYNFSKAVKTKYNYSTSYHGATRSPDRYVIEPDSSINTDDDDDAGLEFVSPPMSIDEMITDLKEVYAWAKSVDAYTNKSTGLHINIGLPNYSLEKLDYIKLALLVGDKYVLDQFGRLTNTYAKSAINKIAEKVELKADELPNLLSMMRNGVAQMASKAIHTGWTDKYTSINTKTGYIEFRSPGGDWLNQDVNKIINTLLRFVVAFDAALDPQKYRQEYLKKFYNLIKPKSEEDPIAYFARYVAGELPQSALKSFVKQIQLQRKAKKQPSTVEPTSGPASSTQEPLWYVLNPATGQSERVRAPSRTHALMRAIRQNSGWNNAYTIGSLDTNDFQVDLMPDLDAPSQPQQSPARPAGGEWTGRWLIRDAAGRVLHQVGGIGNVQADANQFARRWMQQTGYDQPVEIVPEMR